MLVTDGSFIGTRVTAAAELGTRVVQPQDFAVLLEHLQPHTQAASRHVMGTEVLVNLTDRMTR